MKGLKGDICPYCNNPTSWFEGHFEGNSLSYYGLYCSNEKCVAYSKKPLKIKDKNFKEVKFFSKGSPVPMFTP